MKVGLLKLGKATYWDPADWKTIGADVEIRFIVRILSEYVEQMHYWGVYQLGNAKKDLPKNLVLHSSEDFRSDNIDAVMADIEATDVDAFFVINGPMGINNRGYQMFERYVYPTIEVLNRIKVPWVYMYSDPRYYWKAMELAKAPAHILAQYPLENQVRNVGHVPIAMKYSYFDIAGFGRLDNPKQDYPLEGRERIVRLIGNAKPGFYKEWMENFVPDLEAAGIPWEVWGIWPDAPDDDPRFRPIGLHDNWDTLTKTAYTVVLAVPSAMGKTYPFTCRWYEVAASDAVTFVNRHYDGMYQRIPKDSPLRVQTGKQLVLQINTFERDPAYKRAVIDWQRSQFNKEHETPAYMAGQILYYLQDGISNPDRKAFDETQLNPRLGVAHHEVDDDPERYVEAAIIKGENMKLATGMRMYNLIGRALDAWGYIRFTELVKFFERDAHWNSNNYKNRDARHSAARAFGILSKRGFVRDATGYADRDLDYDAVIQSAPEYREIEVKKRSRGAKRGTTLPPMLTGGVREEIVGIGDVELENEVDTPRFSRSKRATKPGERRLIATVTDNPYRSGSNTYIHFTAVMEAGSVGITQEELADYIERTNTQGVQTGVRLAAWSFSKFPRDGSARISTEGEETKMVPIIYADGAQPQVVLELAKKYDIRGATYNPTLCKKLGVQDYPAFIQYAAQTLQGFDQSFQILTDDPATACVQASQILALAPNAYVKVPIINRNGDSMAYVIQHLTRHGVKVNVTSVFTPEQVNEAYACRTEGVPHIVSVFCGRIADAGYDPREIMSSYVAKRPEGVQLLWAGSRQAYDYVQAAQVGCDIITLPPDLIVKALTLVGKSLEQFAIETVNMFINDGSEFTL